MNNIEKLTLCRVSTISLKYFFVCIEQLVCFRNLQAWLLGLLSNHFSMRETNENKIWKFLPFLNFGRDLVRQDPRSNSSHVVFVLITRRGCFAISANKNDHHFTVWASRLGRGSPERHMRLLPKGKLWFLFLCYFLYARCQISWKTCVFLSLSLACG